MRRTIAVALASALLAACSPPDAPGASPTPKSTAPSVEEHESGPQSPIAFGLTVPGGATQLGPLLRFRTDRVLQAYEPDLRAALARQAVADARRDARRNDEGLPLETPPTPPPVAKPRPDTFALLEEPPAPNVTISFMRIDGNPATAVRTMAAQIAQLLPDDAISPEDMRSYCTFVQGVIERCRLIERGRTPTNAELEVAMTVDPGVDGVAPAGSGGKPVMTVSVTNAGDPRAETPEDVEIDIEAPRQQYQPKWPAVTSTAGADAPLLDDWALPEEATLMLSGMGPLFATAVTRTGREADAVARDFASQGTTTVERDVVEELNEIRTTYTGVTAAGVRLVGSFVVTARGNYVLLARIPPMGWR